MAKQQFNVNLDAGLVRRVKHSSIDAQLSLSDFVAGILDRHLTNVEAPVPEDTSTTSNALVLQPMVHVQDMSASVAFYEALGATLQHGSRDGDFAMLRIGSSELSLLAHPPNPEQHEGLVELNFESRQPLERLEAGLREAGVTIAQPTSDEGFGRQLQLTTPDGLLVKINELEPELYS